MFLKHKIICLYEIAVLCSFSAYILILFCFLIKICEQIQQGRSQGGSKGYGPPPSPPPSHLANILAGQF